MEKATKAKQRAARAKKLGLKNKGKARIQYVSKEKYSMFEDDLQEERTRRPRRDNDDFTMIECRPNIDLRAQEEPPANKGGRPKKNITDLGKRHRNRLLKEYVDSVLKNVESGLLAVGRQFNSRLGCAFTVLSLKVNFPTDDGKTVVREYQIFASGEEITITETGDKKSCNTQSDEDIAHHVFYEATVGSVSSHALQNLLSASQSKVKAHVVRALRKRMNSSLDEDIPILQLKSGCDAYYIDPEKYLNFILPSLCHRGIIGRCVTLCLSGDGRNMKVLREKSSIIISMKIITDNPFSTEYVIPVALAKGKECRENIELIFSFLRAGFINVRRNGVRFGKGNIPVRLTFCADGKFMLMALGIHAANGQFSCPYCVLKKEYWVSSVDNVEYIAADDLRNPKDLRKRVGQGACLAHTGTTCGASSHGVTKSSILHEVVDHQDVFVDELHLFLRLWDCVIEYLIVFVEHWEIVRYNYCITFIYGLFSSTF